MMNSLASRRLFSDAAAALGGGFAPFGPAPAVGERDAWGGLPAALREDLVARGADVLVGAWPILPASAYRDFVRRGDRAGFEALYFERRRRLCTLVLAECAEDRGRFLDAAIDGILLLCEESGWQLPAHNSHRRGGARQQLPNVDRPVIDLFAAETGALLATVAFLLGERLDAQDPAIVGRIDREIAARILGPYRAGHFWWMGNADEPMNNWTAWCTQNVLLATFARPRDEAVSREIVVKAAASLDAFLKDYGEDGACSEGAFYWRHAALCFSGALDILATVAPSAFAPLWRTPKLRAMADFFADMNVEGPHYFNFGDAAARLDRCGVRELRFARAVGSAPLEALAASDLAADATGDRPDEINLWYRTIELFGLRQAPAKPPAPVRRDSHYPSVGLTVARDGRYALAVKGASNGDSHNHNDVGSVTLWRDGRPFLIDLGVETYTAKTFSPSRYDIWTMQSAWHNLPSFGGVMQGAGAAFEARDHAVDIGPHEVRVSMEIAGAYPAEAGVETYRRTVRLLKGTGVEIVDRWRGARRPELSLLFAEEPHLEANGIALETGARIAVEGGGPMRVEAVDIGDGRLQASWGARIWRVLLPFADRQLRLNAT